MAEGADRSSEGTFDRRYERVARRLIDAGVRPNHVTFLQIPVFIGMAWAAWTAQPWWYFGLSWLVIILDGGDGILARVGRLDSKSGEILDATMDTVGVAVVLWGAAQFQPQFTIPLAVLFVLNVLLYLQNNPLPDKAVSYVRGPIIIGVVAPDTMVVSLAITLGITSFLLVARMPRLIKALATRTPAP